ncbi:hypothetical protein [Reyranella soli]|jgi:hypothetical protein|nr:hypothetical protein [Reyranella soli]
MQQQHAVTEKAYRDLLTTLVQLPSSDSLVRPTIASTSRAT